MGDAVRDGTVPGDPDQTIDGAERRAPSQHPPSGTGRDYATLQSVEREHYSVGNVLAKGGMGRVLEARDLRLGRDVAIKELLPQHRDAARRFEREARITARLQHPAIIHVYEAGVWPGGEPFYAMPKISGRSLDRVVGERATLNERLGLLPNLIAVADALAYAHSEHIVHRDLKPSNVLVGEFGETVVIDWGLAKDLAAVAGDPKESLELRVRALEQETVSGSVVGTPAYMPPEQARGEPVDQRADVYALGAMLYKVLAGVAPYVGESSAAVLELVKAGPPAPIGEREPGAPADLVAIVGKAMARSPRDRYESAVAFAQDLKRFQTGQLVAAHRYTTPELLWRWLKRYRVVVVAAIVLAVVAAVFVRRIVVEKARAERGRIALLEERGRSELLAGRAGNALAYLAGAAHDGVTGGSRGFLIADAMRPFQAEGRRLEGGPLVAVSGDGKVVATAGTGPVAVVSLADGLERELGNIGASNALAIDATGDRIAAGDGTGTVRVWKRDGTLLAQLRLHTGVVGGIAFSPDGARLATAGSDGIAHVVDLASKKVVATSTCHSAAITSVRFSPDGERLVTASEDKSACVWNAGTGEIVQLLRGHAGAVGTAIWTPDGERVITASADGTARVWTALYGKLVVTPLAHERGSIVTAVAVSSDGRLVVTAGTDHVARVWQLPPASTSQDNPPVAREVQTLVGHGEAIVAVAFADDDSVVATAGLDDLAKLWEPSTGRTRGTFETDAATVAVAFADGNARLITGASDGTTRVWNALISKRHENVLAPVHALAAAPDGTIAAGTEDTRVWLLRPQPKSKPLVVASHLGRVLAAVFTPDGKQLVSAGEDAPIYVTDVATGGPVATLVDTSLTEQPTRALAMSPDGGLIAAATTDGIRLWSLADRKLVRVLHDRGTTLVSVAFAANGELVVGGAEDGTLVMWSRDGRQIESRSLGSGAIVQLAVAGDFVAAAGPTIVQLFRVTDGRLAELVLPSPIKDPSQLRAVAFSRDRSLVITAGLDGVKVWDAEKGKLLGRRDERDALSAVAVVGDTLWTASDNHTIDAWDIRIEDRPADVIDEFVAAYGPWRLDEHDVLYPRKAPR